MVADLLMTHVLSAATLPLPASMPLDRVLSCASPMKHGTGAALLAVVSVVAAVLVAACTSDRADSAAPPDRYRETGVSSGTGEPGASDASAPAPDGPATPPPTAPSGCGLTTKKGLESRSLNVDGKPRTYLKVVPTA